MPVTRTYLDYNASAPMLPEASAAMVDALALTGNASSVHFEGRQARATVEKARREVAVLVGAKPDCVIFTSGATEAANLALVPRLKQGRGEVDLDRLYISTTEHPCVLAGGQFPRELIETVPVLPSGIIDLDAFAKILAQRGENDTPFLMALQWVNNETGIIQPVGEVTELVHNAGGFLLVDTVQAAGRIPIDIANSGVDMLMLSAHKIGGPQGIGALVLADKSLAPLPLMKGGAQENHHRAGTENVAAIAGFGAAAMRNLALLDRSGAIAALRDSIESSIRSICISAGNACGQLEIFGSSVSRVANTSCFAVAGISAETALISLDLDGIAVSSGAACSSGSVKPSHVLDAMGINDDLSRCALRVSLGWNSSQADVDQFLVAWKNIMDRMGSRARAI